MPKSSYEGSVRHLFTLLNGQGMQLGVERVARLDQALGSPSRQFQAVHIGGTNGKGTVSWKCFQTLSANGYKAGLFSSPHIATFRERMRIADRMISEAEVVELLDEISVCAQQIGEQPTFFEITTLMALLWFARNQVEIAVIEVGIGGRLDATNIVQSAVSVITGIGFDHCDLLGQTLDQIASEKAGILRPAVPALLGPTVPHTVLDRAQQLGTPVIQVNGTDVEQVNRRLVAGALDQLVDLPTPDRSALAARPPCRAELCEHSQGYTLLDVAHNPQAMSVLKDDVERRFHGPADVCLAAFTARKDPAACLRAMRSWSSRLCLTQAVGTLPVEQLRCIAIEEGWEPSQIMAVPDVTSAMEATACYSKRVVCGTFLIMAEARYCLGIGEPRDPWVLQEAGTVGKIWK